MIIKRIVLDNIRSYEHEEIELKPGSTLLSGDIGSGKTSILLAIEFGLFGLQPGQRGSALLKNGKDEGSVSIEFDIDGKNVLIERKLKRGKNISQDSSSITIDGEKEEISVSELKQRVLEILNYPQEFSKKQNLLYKFTVYTPQEEMKAIILEDSEVRINTLRHVFGIDKYKTIIENAGVLRLKLREEKRLLEGVTSNLDEDKKEISKKEEELEKLKKSTKEFESNLNLSLKKRKEKEKEKEEISIKIEEKNEIKQELGKSRMLALSKMENASNNEKRLKEVKNEIENFNLINVNEKKIGDIEKNIFENKQEREKIGELSIKINSEIEMLKTKIEEHNKLHNTMSDLKVCPTCQQDVDAVYRANILNKTYNEISHSKNRIEELTIQRNENIKKLSSPNRQHINSSRR